MGRSTGCEDCPGWIGAVSVANSLPIQAHQLLMQRLIMIFSLDRFLQTTLTAIDVKRLAKSTSHKVGIANKAQAQASRNLNHVFLEREDLFG